METAKKWFYRLPFPEYLEEPFLKAISGEETSEAMTNLVNLLSECDKTEEFYKKKGMPEEILIETLSDIAVWAENLKIEKGDIGVMETGWLRHHLNCEIFKIGRLQFMFGKGRFESQEHELSVGDNTMEVHIPRGEKLTPELARDSIKRAISFFERYFPEYDYKLFTCESWTLDITLRKFLKEGSNLLSFGDLFDRVASYPSTQAFRYLFDLNPNKEIENSFQKQVREFTDNGGKLYQTYGVIPKERAREYENL